ncbi:MAG: type II toxin-antitoxin system PemK/MazF family toxin [Saprospiraceae bacterium]|nr:type II toxin-antitoxin system PemK/MazF family toxin [Saprospiraceae bacterium]
MAGFVRGEIVVLPFPFSDLSNSKRRPALVLADLPGDDIILCQITSQYAKDGFAVQIGQSEFKSGALAKLSYIRPNRIFTADKSIIIKKVAQVKEEILQEIIETIIDLISK